MDISEIRRENLFLVLARFKKQIQFVDAVGTDTGYVSQLKKGITPTGRQVKMGDDFARNVEEKLGLEKGWMDKSHNQDADRAVEQTLQGLGVAIRSDELPEEDERIWLDVHDIKFCCGDGGDIEFHYEVITKKILPFEPSFFTKRKVKPANMILAYANNDSNDPYIKDGDLFGMDISDTSVRDGEMYAIYFGNQAMLKQIFIEANGYRLHSINENKYPDRYVTEENGSDFRIIGRQFYRSG